MKDGQTRGMIMCISGGEESREGRGESGGDGRKRRVSKTAEELVFFIVRFKRTHDGVGPSYREMGEFMGGYSISVISYWLHKLEAAGAIRLLRDERGKWMARGIKVAGGNWELRVSRLDEVLYAD